MTDVAKLSTEAEYAQRSAARARGEANTSLRHLARLAWFSPPS
jgi:hypothetical protein